MPTKVALWLFWALAVLGAMLNSVEHVHEHQGFLPCVECALCPANIGNSRSEQSQTSILKKKQSNFSEPDKRVVIDHLVDVRLGSLLSCEQDLLVQRKSKIISQSVLFSSYSNGSHFGRAPPQLS